MSNYEFQSMSYRTSGEMAAAIAGEWLSACGHNPREFMVEELRHHTDAELADDCIEGWALNQKPDWLGEENPKTWMEQREISRDDIVAAFADLRRDFDARFPEG